MSEVKRYHRDDDEFERYECELVVDEKDFDRVTAERDGLQSLLTAADEELDQCQSMARMIEEKEWAEHVGKGPISSLVESAFTQLHNELSEARQGLTEADERADSFDRLYTSSLDERDQLQQRADVLESRRGDFELALMWVRSQLTDPKIVQFIDIALKPAEGGGDDS